MSPIAWRILWSRFLTKSGDQAWDFAVPIFLLKIFPDRLQIAAAYYLLAKAGQIFFLPSFASLIDRISRLKAAQIGIGLQVVSVCISALAVLYGLNQSATVLSPWMLLLIAGGIGSSLGASFMDISVAQDLAPSALPESELPRFNSRLRQLDLFTEVSAPIAAGSLLLLEPSDLPGLGFMLIVLWNILSFIPEYGLLKAAVHLNPELMKQKEVVASSSKVTLLSKLTNGWKVFLRQPMAPAMFCYALLWLSALSPHGVLLTGFLKDGWQMPEVVIGAFRGLGALFGLTATILFPILVARMNVMRASRVFIQFQALMVLCSLAAFFINGLLGQLLFLGFILLSRIGLYGFSLGEMQLRQTGIAPSERGAVNGFASALTSVATLGLYASGALLPSTKDFEYLVIGSTLFVLVSAIAFSIWASGGSNRKTV